MNDRASWKPVLQALLILAAVFVIYGPCLHGGWLWDDNRYITNNQLLRSGSGLWKIWFKPGATNDYYPVEATVQWIQWQFWGMDTFGYHLTNVLLHVVNSLLVWRLLGKFGLRLAWLGGLLFAIHPVQVESVAWIAELKNTLSLLPLLLAMGAWIDYVESGRRAFYFWALGLFLTALLCKITAVMFPVVLLLHAWWKRGRIGGNDVKLSGPFFALSLAIGLITVASGVWDKQFSHLGPDVLPPDGAMGRFVLAGMEIAFYFSRCFLPVGLSPVYPKWSVDIFSPVDYVPWIVLAAGLAWLWTKRAGWGRHALLGVGFFLINLLPCPGFIPAPNMGYAWVMDHFLYLPIIGLIGLIVAMAEQAGPRLPRATRVGGAGLVALVAAVFIYNSRAYSEAYRDSTALWSYTLRQNDRAWPAYTNLGLTLMHDGRLPEALEKFQRAVSIDPNLAELHVNLGSVLRKSGRMLEAIAQFDQALALDPSLPDAHNNLGNALRQLGRVPEALAQYEQAVKLDPRLAESHNNLGAALAQSGRLQEAIGQFELALQIQPDYAKAHNNLGRALYKVGRTDEAAKQFEQATKYDPENPDFRRDLNNLRAGEKAASLNP